MLEMLVYAYKSKNKDSINLKTKSFSLWAKMLLECWIFWPYTNATFVKEWMIFLYLPKLNFSPQDDEYGWRAMENQLPNWRLWFDHCRARFIIFIFAARQYKTTVI